MGRKTIEVIFKSGASTKFKVGEFTATHRGSELVGYKFDDADPNSNPLFLKIESIDAIIVR